MLQIIHHRKFWFTVSGAMFAASMLMIAVFGLRYGIDFTGGSLLEVRFAAPVENSAIEQAIKDAETEARQSAGMPTVTSIVVQQPAESATALPEESGIIELGTPLIQKTDAAEHVIIRTKYMSNQTHDVVLKHLAIINGNQPVTEYRFETIGPTIGETLKRNAVTAMILASLLIVLYIAYAFRRMPKSLSPWRFGMTAVIGLLHDAGITIGVFALLGATMHVEIDSLFVTALLTVMGFSVHDTIVVFDRIRENVIHRPDDDFAVVANDALNQTLARSINTSLTTLITLVALFILGGASIKWFVLALIVGIIVGTYSSIFVATPLVVAWKKKAVVSAE